MCCDFKCDIKCDITLSPTTAESNAIRHCFMWDYRIVSRCLKPLDTIVSCDGPRGFRGLFWITERRQCLGELYVRFWLFLQSCRRCSITNQNQKAPSSRKYDDGFWRSRSPLLGVYKCYIFIYLSIILYFEIKWVLLLKLLIILEFYEHWRLLNLSYLYIQN